MSSLSEEEELRILLWLSTQRQMCQVTENIYTPTIEGIGNFEGVEGVKDPGNAEGEEDWTVDLVSRWSICFQNSLLTY